MRDGHFCIGKHSKVLHDRVWRRADSLTCSYFWQPRTQHESCVSTTLPIANTTTLPARQRPGVRTANCSRVCHHYLM